MCSSDLVRNKSNVSRLIKAVQDVTSQIPEDTGLPTLGRDKGYILYQVSSSWASIGDIAVVFSRSVSHGHYSLADIQWMIMPPVVLGQFYVAELAHKENGARAPVAAVTWALVSPEVDQRLRAQAAERVTLAPADWKCGEILWLIESQLVAIRFHLMAKSWLGLVLTVSLLRFG